VPKLICIAAALIDDPRGRVLLVRKRGTTFYMQAGGKIELGELAVEALLRELREELEFVPPVGNAVFLGTFHCQAANEPDHMLEAHLFHVRAAEEDFQIGAELDDVLWVEVDAADHLPLAPFTRDYVLPLARSLSRR